MTSICVDRIVCWGIVNNCPSLLDLDLAANTPLNRHQSWSEEHVVAEALEMKLSRKQLHPWKVQEEHSCKASVNCMCGVREDACLGEVADILNPRPAAFRTQSILPSPSLPSMAISVASLVFFAGQGWLTGYYIAPCILPSASQMRSGFGKYSFWWGYKTHFRAGCTSTVFMVSHISVSVVCGQLQVYKAFYEVNIYVYIYWS